MDSLGDLLQNKVNKLDLDAQKTELQIIQQELNRLYDNQVRAIQIKPNGTLLLGARSAPLANELRYQQIELLHVINSAVKNTIQSIQIIIRR